MVPDCKLRKIATTDFLWRFGFQKKLVYDFVYDLIKSVCFVMGFLGVPNWNWLCNSGLFLKSTLVVYMWGLSKHFGPKKSYKINWKNSQRFWTISSLQILPLYIIWSRGIKTFLAQKIIQEKSTKFTNLLYHLCQSKS